MKLKSSFILSTNFQKQPVQHEICFFSLFSQCLGHKRNIKEINENR